MIGRAIITAAFLFVYMTAFYLAARRLRNNGLADTAWGLGFVLVAWLNLFLSGDIDGPFPVCRCAGDGLGRSARGPRVFTQPRQARGFPLRGNAAEMGPARGMEKLRERLPPSGLHPVCRCVAHCPGERA